MKTSKYFILRRKNEDSEGDKYEYFQKLTGTGIEITTPFINAAELFPDEQEYVGVISRDWERLNVSHKMLKKIIH